MVKRFAPSNGMRNCNRLRLQRLWWATTLLLAWGVLAGQAIAQPICGQPRITNQPISLILLAGETADFSVGVHYENCLLNYKWRNFDFFILGATNSSFTIPNVYSNHVGPYSVVVTNVSGAVTSSVAILTVVTGPYVSRRSVNQGEDVTFSILANGIGPATNQWLFNGTDLTGAINGTLILSNVQPSQAGLYAARFSNSAGSVTTTNVTLSVEAAPRLENVIWGVNGFQFDVHGRADATYVIQASNDLEHWKDIATNAAPAGGTLEFTDPAPPFGLRFYRVFKP